MMRHEVFRRLAIGAGAVAWTLAGPAGAVVVIDGFDTQQVLQIPAGGSGAASASGVIAAPQAIGGERDAIASRDMGSGFVDLLVNPSGTDSSLSFALGASPGAATIVWDGPDGNAETLDSDGLGGIDLTQGGVNTGLQVRARSDLATELVFTITGASGGVSDATLDLPAGTAYRQLFLPFSAFGTPELFANAGSLSLQIAGEPGLDVQIALVAAPEPSGAGVALAVLAALAFCHRRRTSLPLG
ncbi:MAG TPA: hypothetical protein VIN04_03130 [Myxococcota bacterium]